MREPSWFRRFVATVIFMAVVIGGSWTAMRLNRQARVYKKQELFHALAAQAFAQHIGGCRLRAETDERAAEALLAKPSVSRDDEAKAQDLLNNARWWRENGAATTKQLEYHKALALKYGRAAGSPWRDVPPDPPAPERWNGQLANQPETVTFPPDELEDAEVEEWRRMVLEHAKAMQDRVKKNPGVDAAAVD